MSSHQGFRNSQVWTMVLVIGVGLTQAGSVFAQKPLKVFILAGQSNMQGHAHVRTLPHLAMDPATSGILSELQTDDGSALVSENVWVSYLSSAGVKQGQLATGFGADENKIGPELTFGLYAQKLLDEPILIIKTAWGGKSLHTDFRPPSAGPCKFNEFQLKQFEKQGKDINEAFAEREKLTGIYYREMLNHVKSVLADVGSVYPDFNESVGYDLAGFVWFQGWNDMVDRGAYPKRDKPGGYDQYSETLAHLIRDVRKDLASPELPFVIGVMGVGGPTKDYSDGQKRYQTVHQNFRDAMAQVATLEEFHGNVLNVRTEDCWDQQLSKLKARENKVKQVINQMKKAGELTGAAVAQKQKLLMEEELSATELEILKTGVSNFEFHYLGSAKIMARIGKEFAETLLAKRQE